MSANDNTPFDKAAWKRKYQREYMRKRRERERGPKTDPPTPPPPAPPPENERRARAYRMKAEELRTIAETMRSPHARQTWLRLANDYQSRLNALGGS